MLRTGRKLGCLDHVLLHQINRIFCVDKQAMRMNIVCFKRQHHRTLSHLVDRNDTLMVVTDKSQCEGVKLETQSTMIDDALLQMSTQKSSSNFLSSWRSHSILFSSLSVGQQLTLDILFSKKILSVNLLSLDFIRKSQLIPLKLTIEPMLIRRLPLMHAMEFVNAMEIMRKLNPRCSVGLGTPFGDTFLKLIGGLTPKDKLSYLSLLLKG